MTPRRSLPGHRLSLVVVIVFLLVGCGSSLPTPLPPPPSADGPSTPTDAPSPTDTIGPVGREQLGAVAVAFFDERHGLVVGAGGPSGTIGVIRATRDGGRTWGPTIALDSGPLVSVAVVPSGRAWAVAACGVDAPLGCVEGVFRSDDGGATWARVSSTVALSPSFVDDDHGWATAETNEPSGDTTHGLLGTIDGGRTWQAATTGCSGRFGGTVAVSFVDRLHGWVACNETYGAGAAAKGISETIDGGRDWLVRSGTSGGQGAVGSIDWSDYLFALAMRPNGTGMWLGRRGTTAQTSTSGRTWTYGPPGEFDVGIPSGESLVTDRTWFLVMWLADAQETALERSDDAGNDWSVVGGLGPP